MQTSIVVFPGSNRDRDMIAAVEKISGKKPNLVWHQDKDLPKSDLVILPGGFSYGDYLRSGAIAARAPIMGAIADAASRGAYVLGVCNGFQILAEAGLLPGTLMRNASLKFVCREVQLRVENHRTHFTSGYAKNQVWRCPVAHHDGNYFAEPDTLRALEDNDQVAFTYAQGTNPNGSIHDIAGVFDRSKRILGMMPHPENLIEPAHGGTDGRPLFEAILNGVPA